MVNNIQYIPTQGKSDHICLVLKTNMNVQTSEKCKLGYSNHKRNYQKMTDNLKHTDWRQRLEDLNTKKIVDTF